MLSIRCNDLATAVSETEKALAKHPSTGRLWALLIQLKHVVGEEAQWNMFKRALQEVRAFLLFVDNIPTLLWR